MAKGYGLIWVGGRHEKAHRVAYFLAQGAWPEPFCLHDCDNPQVTTVGK